MQYLRQKYSTTVVLRCEFCFAHLDQIPATHALWFLKMDEKQTCLGGPRIVN